MRARITHDKVATTPFELNTKLHNDDEQFLSNLIMYGQLVRDLNYVTTTP